MTNEQQIRIKGNKLTFNYKGARHEMNFYSHPKAACKETVTLSSIRTIKLDFYNEAAYSNGMRGINKQLKQWLFNELDAIPLLRGSHYAVNMEYSDAYKATKGSIVRLEVSVENRDDEDDKQAYLPLYERMIDKFNELLDERIYIELDDSEPPM